jgi:hypothetical protein
MPIQGRVPYSGGPGDLIERHRRAVLGDELRGPREQRFPVAAAVGTWRAADSIRGFNSHIE